MSSTIMPSRRHAASAISLAAPSSAFAGTGSTSLSFLSSLMQMFFSLAVVIGVIYVFYHFANKWSKKYLNQSFSGKHISLVEKFYMGPRKSLALVKVGREYLLLGNSEDGLRFLKNIEIDEESLEAGLAGDIQPDTLTPGFLQKPLSALRTAQERNFCTSLDASISKQISRLKDRISKKTANDQAEG